MAKENIHIMLIDDVKRDIVAIKDQLYSSMKVPFVLTHVNTLTEALSMLRENTPPIDVVLLDLGLVCEHHPQAIFELVEAIVHEIPIIVITGNQDHELALLAMNAGASDNITQKDFHETYGKLRDSIAFSLARGNILHSARRETKDSEMIRAELMNYIGGQYSCDNDKEITPPD
ncbi:MAG: response regulator [Alphaproteobacteria bacterium]